LTKEGFQISSIILLPPSRWEELVNSFL
jgi:hypothetical protein